MPVYERSYRHFEGTRTPQAGRFLVVAGEALRAAMRSRWVWVLVAATVVHVGIRTAILYFTSRVPTGPGGIPAEIRDQILFGPRFMADAMDLQIRWILLLLLALVGAPALPRDRQAGALQFYFSRPITPFGYALGKLLPPFGLGLFLTAGPALVLWVVGVAFTPTQLYPDGVWVMPLVLLLSGALAAGIATLVVVAVSGVVQNARLAAASWVAVGLLTSAAARILHAATGRDGTLLLGFFDVIDRVVESMFGVAGSDVPETGAWLVATAWVAASAAGLWLMLRDPEVAA